MKCNIGIFWCKIDDCQSVDLKGRDKTYHVCCLFCGQFRAECCHDCGMFKEDAN